jgi:tetratricopeptide (TPR) repeat protein
MTELAAALRPPRRRSRALIFVAAGLALGATIGVVAYRHAASSGDSCSGGPARVATAWSPDTRARIETTFGGTPWLSQTLAALDGKAIDWQTTYRHVCLATKKGEQSGALLDLRMRCLDRELDRFAALTTVLSASVPTTGSGSAASLEIAARVAAPSAISEIDVATCERLTDPGELAFPADQKEREKVREQQRDLDRAQALFSLGRYPQARAALPAADAVTLPRLRAERLSLDASIEARVGSGETARTLLDQALIAAAEANAPRVELDIWSRRLKNELFAGDPAKVLEWESFARAAAKHAGLDGAEIDGVVGQALRASGQLARATKLLDGALASSDPLRPEQRALLEMNRGSIDLETGHSAAALERFTEARDLVLTAFGDKHPELAIYDDKIAAAYRAQGKLRKAMEFHAQSLALRTAVFGEDDRAVATSLLYRAQTELEAGDVFAADADATKAKSIREKVYGPKSPRLGEVYELMADISTERGVPELGAQQRATAIALDPRLVPVDGATKLGSESDKDVDLSIVTSIGEALLAAGDSKGAVAVLAPAAKRLGNEPTRTGLHLMIAYAKASRDPQVARTTVSLYQALPKLDRSEYDAIWALSTKQP